MTLHDDLYLASAWPALYEQHGREVTYRPRGVEADDVTIPVLWQLGDLLTGYQPDDLGEVVEHMGLLRARPADVATPHREDLFVIDGDVWSVAMWGRRSPLRSVQLRRYEQGHARGARRIG